MTNHEKPPIGRILKAGEKIKKERKPLELDGIQYEVVHIPFGGWGMGAGSTVRALNGPNAGKLYLADIGFEKPICRIREIENNSENKKDNNLVE
jgi:hypothetical protein